VCVVLVAVLLVPALGVAGDGRLGSHGEAGLRHQAPWSWRTTFATVAAPVTVPRAVPLAWLDAPEPQDTSRLVVRAPFVPPRC